MKILMVLEAAFPPDIRVENEINSLLELGHDIDIACYKKDGQENTGKFSSCNIIRKAIPEFIHKSSVGALNFPFYFNFWQTFLEECFQNKKYDAIHIHDLQLAKLGSYFKQKYNIKFILDLHENWPVLLDISAHTKTFLGKLLFSYNRWVEYETKYAKLADKVIVVIDEAKERLIKLGIDSNKIHIVQNTLNMDLFDFELEKRNDDKVVLTYGGGVNYHRGLQDVLRAIALLPKQARDIELWIVGNGTYISNLKTLAKNLNIEDKVVFYGWKKQNEYLKIISEADIALIPHIKSGHSDNTIPHKIFQYMYAGLPIISSNCNPLERIIKETHSGLVFESGNSNSLSTILNSILDNSISLDEFKHSKHWVEEKYNWAEDTKVLKELYNNLISYKND